MKAVIVFTKVPERGNVKTRLQKRLPAYHVEEIYIAFLEDTLEKLRSYYPYVAYWPENKLQALWTLIGDRKFLAQRGKEMDEKILNVFTDFYRMGIKKTLVVNCDVPTLETKHVDEAFKLMEGNDIVIGPAHDGGFYLIGGAAVKKELFEGATIGEPGAFERIKSNAERLKLKVGLTPLLHDVDTPEDLDAVWSSGLLDKEGHTYKTLKKILQKR